MNNELWATLIGSVAVVVALVGFVITRVTNHYAAQGKQIARDLKQNAEIDQIRVSLKGAWDLTLKHSEELSKLQQLQKTLEHNDVGHVKDIERLDNENDKAEQSIKEISLLVAKMSARIYD